MPKCEAIQRDAIRAVLTARYPGAYLDSLPVLYFGADGPAFIGYAESLHGAEVLLEAAGNACLYITRAKLDRRDFFIGT